MPTALLRCCLRQLLPLLWLWVLAAGPAQAQPEPIKFGLVAARDLTAAPFVDDSATPAVILCDYGKTRQFPVDFGYGRDETLVVSLTLPTDYALAELPKSKALNLPDKGRRYVCSVTATGTAVQLTSRLTLRKPIYSVAEYGALRELYQQLLAKQTEKSVVKKQG